MNEPAAHGHRVQVQRPDPPFVRELDKALSPMVAARRLAHLPHLIVLESAMQHDRLGRFSFVAADPVQWQQGDQLQSSAVLTWLDETLSRHAVGAVPELPPFQGGVAGLLSYEFARAFEDLPCADFDDLPVPHFSLGLYDVVIGWDHWNGRCWLVSQGLAARNGQERLTIARERADWFGQQLLRDPAPPQFRAVPRKDIDRSLRKPAAWRGLSQLASNFDPGGYRSAVEAALEYIRAGDIFQANLAQRLLHPVVDDCLSLYERLRAANPAPFAGYLDGGSFQLASASPERLFSIRQRRIETRPIKGTRPRTHRPEVDIDVGLELRASEKDRAENVMIVDLMRNDLSRVCTSDSVRVTQLLGLEKYASVLHLVSAIEGQLRADVRISDVLAALFPGGSVTGAPKIRAMQIIAELERVARGPWCGSLGWFGLDGSADLNILIRTITCAHGWWQIPVGGGIVIGSDPQAEYEETWTKAAGMLQALQ